jgi:hypothetical protein
MMACPRHEAQSNQVPRSTSDIHHNWRKNLRTLKIPNALVQETVAEEPPTLPKYASQIINLANQNAQGTRPRVVGQLSDLIQDFPGDSYAEWVSWYAESGYSAESCHPFRRKPATLGRFAASCQPAWVAGRFVVNVRVLVGVCWLLSVRISMGCGQGGPLLRRRPLALQ